MSSISSPCRPPARRQARGRLARAALLVVLVGWPLSGCSQLGLTPTARVAELAEGSVPLQIVRDPTGSVLPLVAISIGDQGPFTFVVDTGASRTVIDRQVAERLQLETAPGVPIASDVSGAVQASVVRVRQWRAGAVELPQTIAAAVELSGPNSPALQQLVGQHLDGLLGSDVLNEFGAVTIDYRRGQLVLTPS